MKDRVELLARMTQAPLAGYTEAEKIKLYQSLRRQGLSLLAILWEICTGEKPPAGK